MPRVISGPPTEVALPRLPRNPILATRKAAAYAVIVYAGCVMLELEGSWGCAVPR